MVFGYKVVQGLLVLVRIFSRLPIQLAASTDILDAATKRIINTRLRVRGRNGGGDRPRDRLVATKI